MTYKGYISSFFRFFSSEKRGFYLHPLYAAVFLASCETYDTVKTKRVNTVVGGFYEEAESCIVGRYGKGRLLTFKNNVHTDRTGEGTGRRGYTSYAVCRNHGVDAC